MNSDKFLCSHLWSHIVVDFAKAQFRNCCKTSPIFATEKELETTTFFANSDQVVTARKQMLNGERPDMCGVCWRLEDQNLPSHRSTPLEWLNQINSQENTKLNLETLLRKSADELAQSKAPVNLDIQLDNACDLKCIYCNEEYSTQWEKEKRTHGPMPHDTYVRPTRVVDPAMKERFEQQFWNWFSEHKMGFRRIAFLGGEPLYSTKFIPALERLQNEYKDVPEGLEINIITNLNAKEEVFQRFLELIRKCQNKFIFNINISMDAWGEKAEFIRSGVQFERFQKNFERLMTLTDRNRVVLSTITSINLFALSSLHQYLDWLLKIQVMHKRPVILYHNLVSFPSWLGLDMASTSLVPFVEQARAVVQNGLVKQGDWLDFSWHRYQTFLEQIEKRIAQNEPPNLDQQKLFSESVLELKKRRGVDVANIFPEYQFLPLTDVRAESEAEPTLDLGFQN